MAASSASSAALIGPVGPQGPGKARVGETEVGLAAVAVGGFRSVLDHLLSRRYALVRFARLDFTRRGAVPDGALSSSVGSDWYWALGRLPGGPYEVLGAWCGAPAQIMGRIAHDLSVRGVERIDQADFGGADERADLLLCDTATSAAPFRCLVEGGWRALPAMPSVTGWDGRRAGAGSRQEARRRRRDRSLIELAGRVQDEVLRVMSRRPFASCPDAWVSRLAWALERADSRLM